jgi:hypothetical protein
MSNESSTIPTPKISGLVAHIKPDKKISESPGRKNPMIKPFSAKMTINNKTIPP